MRVAVLGAGGVLGRLVAATAPQGVDLAAHSHASCDVTRVSDLNQALAGAEVVINCAAFTNVDAAETDAAAFRVNTEAPAAMAEECRRSGATLIHVSTDFVFGGAPHPGRPWREDDPVAPINAYGRSKADGEAAIRSVLERHVIVRSSWLFGPGGTNFVAAIRRLAETRRVLDVVADQRGGPTPAAALAQALWRIAERAGPRGTFHFAGAPAVSRAEFARAILADRPEVEIRPVTSAAFPAPARRPADSELDCTRIREAYGLEQPDWRPYLAEDPHRHPGRSGA